MREIQFRAWNKVTKEMLPHRTNDGELYAIKALDYPEIYELMQYTGLKDKNGKEIYEGDIMSVNGEIAKVYYDQNNVCFCLDTDIDYNPCIGRYEVIGNIYENPELIK